MLLKDEPINVIHCQGHEAKDMNKIQTLQTLFIEFQKKSSQIDELERQLNRLKNEREECRTKLKNELKDDRPCILRVRQGKVVRRFKVDSSGEMFEV